MIGWAVDRSKCILAERDGTLWSADARGGVTRIRADGTQGDDDSVLYGPSGGIAPGTLDVTTMTDKS